MPSKSKKQHNLMQMAAAGKSDKVPAKVGKEFVAADKAAGKYQGKKDKPKPKAKPGKKRMPPMKDWMV